MGAATIRLLLVDDNPADRDLMRAYLREGGLEFDAVDAATLEETRHEVASLEPHCVLLDMHLPDGLAVELAAELAHTPWPMGVIIVTGRPRDRDAVRAIRGGIQDYVDKNQMEPESLTAAVRKAIQRAQLAHERAAALTALEEADRRKTEFMGMLGHELRNPLNAITTALELVHEDDPESHDTALAVIRRQTKHLRRLVDDLLEASRISRGNIDLQREPVRLDEVALSAAEVLRPVMEKKHQTFEVSVGSEPLEVYGDPVRIEQMIINLLGNATKYTDEGGSITLSVEAEGDHAHVTVRDDGIGMDPATLREVFEPFVQADRSLARSEGGLGLGLALVRKLAILHGGKVEADSRGLGRGSTFRVTFPRRWQQPAIARTAPLADGTPVPTGRRVLLVEDHEDAAELLSLLLRRWGFTVSLACDGERALELAREIEPDIILLDIGLPRMNGYELARRIRGDAELESVLLLAVSGYGAPEDRARSKEVGFDAHLVKPVDPGVLRNLLRVA